MTPLMQIAFGSPCVRYKQQSRGCSLHGRCGEADRVERGETRVLSGCADFAAAGGYVSAIAPDLLPGLADPLPVPESVRKPSGWTGRQSVRAAHVAALRRLLAAEIPPPAKAEGEGIVVCGGGRYWPMVVVSVRMAREVTALPIQVWHRGDYEPVEPADLAGVPDVEIVDATRFRPRILRGWEIKGLALLHCGWERVLYLDADAYLVGDPRPLLDLAVPERPFVFWQDIGGDNAVKWEMTGIPAEVGQAIPCVQGGQLAILRSAMWRELVLFHWLNQHSDYFYEAGWGDQDQWRIAIAATSMTPASG